MAVSAVIPLALAAVGTAVSVVSAIHSANATAQAQAYQAQVAARQRDINLQNAQRALERSRQEQIQQDQQTRALLGEQIAAQSASGLKLGGRSQMLTRKSARELGRMDALNVVQAGEIEAYNFRIAAEDASSESQFLTQSANNTRLAGWLDAGSALVSGLRGFPQIGLPSGRNAPSILGTSRRYRSSFA